MSWKGSEILFFGEGGCDGICLEWEHWMWEREEKNGDLYVVGRFRGRKSVHVKEQEATREVVGFRSGEVA